MSTQNKQTSTNTYDPGSMGTFQGLNKQFGSAISEEISNPYSNPFFNLQQQRGTQMINAQNASGNQALLQRAQALGIDPRSPQFMQMMNQQSRSNQGNMSNLNSDLMLQATQMRQQAIGQAGGYRPLQTGGTQTQTQSGLGTWLPQVAGMAIKGGMMAATGGMSGLMGGGGGNPFFPGSGAGPDGTYSQVG
jgi:hypothetical protein